MDDNTYDETLAGTGAGEPDPIDMISGELDPLLLDDEPAGDGFSDWDTQYVESVPIEHLASSDDGTFVYGLDTKKPSGGPHSHMA